MTVWEWIETGSVGSQAERQIFAELLLDTPRKAVLTTWDADAEIWDSAFTRWHQWLFLANPQTNPRIH